METEVYVAKSKDASLLSKFYRHIISKNPYYSPEAIKSELERFSQKNISKELKIKDNLYIFTKEKDKIIGACNGYYEAGMFWVDWLIVDPLKRRNVIGSAMMLYLENKLTKQGIHKIWNDSRTTNKESKALLVKLGFKKIASIKKHWYKQDFILWQKVISK